MRNKDKLIEQLLAHTQVGGISLESAKVGWFYNIRPNGGLRLTDFGLACLKDDLKLEYYSYTIKDPISFNQRTILALDRKLTMPYYIVTKKSVPTTLIFFGSREAVLINLYGDLDKFLDNYN